MSQRTEFLRALGPMGEEVAARVEALHAARPVGDDHIDAGVHALLEEAGGGLTTREIAGRLHLAVDTAARSVHRLVVAGRLEGDGALPRRYRVVPFFLPLMPGYAVERPEGKSWNEQLVTPCFHRDGTRVVLFVTPGSQRVHDGGAARLRVGDEVLRRHAAARGVRLEDGELAVEPATPELVAALAHAVADVDG